MRTSLFGAALAFGCEGLRQGGGDIQTGRQAQSCPQPRDQGLARRIVGRALQGFIDVPEQFGAAVAPVGPSRQAGRQAPVAFQGFRRTRGQSVGLVQAGRDDGLLIPPCRRKTGRQSQAGVGFAVDQEDLARHRLARLQPGRQADGVGVGGIGVHLADARIDAHVVALDAHEPSPFQKHATQGSRRLEAGDQHGCLAPPEQPLQMAPDTASVAHAAARQNDMPVAQPLQPVALLRPHQIAQA
ncbi:hypothetical protein D3C87_1369150 [compost metagenome]